MSRKLLPSLYAILALGVAYACHSDTITTPSGSSARAAQWRRSPAADLAVDTGVETVVALRRVSYLAHDVSESAFVGPQGGEINLKSSGGKIIIPPGALSERIRITMTAMAGWNVAYEFKPHGIGFDLPVTVQQDLSYTVAYRAQDATKVEAGYYPQSLDATYVDGSMSLARLSELRRVDLDRPLNPRLAKFYIIHFSGYLMSSGFADGGGVGVTDSLP